MQVASIEHGFASSSRHLARRIVVRVICGVIFSLWTCVAGSHSHLWAQDGNDWQDQLSKETIEQGEHSLGYRLYQPESASASNKLPLVLFLHGAGERGDDNAAQLKHGVREFVKRQAEHPCFLIVPQCPTGKRWVERNWSEASGRNTFEEEPSPAMALALQAVQDLIAKGNVDTSRVYVTGLSMGGYGTWYASGYKGNPFAAAAPICGGGDPTWAKRYVDKPLWVFHGDADSAVPVERSREMIKAIQAAGGEPKYTEYPGVGHDSWTQTYRNDQFHQWLFSQQQAE